MQKKIENIHELNQFRRICKQKRVFFVSNDLKLASILKADGIYISAFNKDLSLNRLKNSKFEIIGSAHNLKEINTKIMQGCKISYFPEF